MFTKRIIRPIIRNYNLQMLLVVVTAIIMSVMVCLWYSSNAEGPDNHLHNSTTYSK